MSNEEKNNKQPETEEQQPQGNKRFLYLYIAIGCFAAGCILFALSFVIYGAGVHMLIASMIAELASVSFINAQKKRVKNTLCTVFTILSYVVMGAALIVFVVGLGIVSTVK